MVFAMKPRDAISSWWLRNRILRMISLTYQGKLILNLYSYSIKISHTVALVKEKFKTQMF